MVMSEIQSRWTAVLLLLTSVTPSLAETAVGATCCLCGMCERLWALHSSLRDCHLLVGIYNGDVPLVVLCAFDHLGRSLRIPIFPLCIVAELESSLTAGRKRNSKVSFSFLLSLFPTTIVWQASRSAWGFFDHIFQCLWKPKYVLGKIAGFWILCVAFLS